jgi:hypothetical protein
VIGISAAKARQPSGDNRQSRNHGDVDKKRRDKEFFSEVRGCFQNEETEYRRSKGNGEEGKEKRGKWEGVNGKGHEIPTSAPLNLFPFLFFPLPLYPLSLLPLFPFPSRYRSREAGSPKSVQVRRTSASFVTDLAARAASPSVIGCGPNSRR